MRASLDPQVLQEARDEHRIERRGLRYEVLQRGVERRVVLPRRQDPFDRRVGRLEAVEPLHRPEGHAAHVLAEAEAEHGGNGPELANRERGGLLEGRHEPRGVLQVDPAFGVRDERDRQLVDARIAGERSAGELRQLAVVAARQAFADFADVLLNDVIVVEQPVAGGADVAPGIGRGQQPAMGIGEDASGGIEAREERGAPPAALREPLRFRERPRALGESFGAEQVTADRAGQDGLVRIRPAAEQAGDGAGKLEGGDGAGLGTGAFRSRVRGGACVASGT